MPIPSSPKKMRSNKDRIASAVEFASDKGSPDIANKPPSQRSPRGRKSTGREKFGLCISSNVKERLLIATAKEKVKRKGDHNSGTNDMSGFVEEAITDWLNKLGY